MARATLPHPSDAAEQALGRVVRQATAMVARLPSGEQLVLRAVRDTFAELRRLRRENARLRRENDLLRQRAARQRTRRHAARPSEIAKNAPTTAAISQAIESLIRRFPT